MAHPPKKLQPILWSVSIDHLDIDKDQHYIINQLLLYGNLEEINWLFRTYGKKHVADVFLKHPAKLYPRPTFYFVKNFLLSLPLHKLDEDDYITSFSGPVRQRAQNRLS